VAVSTPQSRSRTGAAQVSASEPKRSTFESVKRRGLLRRRSPSVTLGELLTAYKGEWRQSGRRRGGHRRRRRASEPT
jgi:hypothetical protein